MIGYLKMKLIEDIENVAAMGIKAEIKAQAGPFIKYTILGWIRDNIGFHNYIEDRVEPVRDSLIARLFDNDDETD